MRGMRNFWITGDMDGRQTSIAIGPGTGKDAGFNLTVFMRDNGESVKGCEITGRVKRDGSLVLEVDGAGKGLVFTKQTDR